MSSFMWIILGAVAALVVVWRVLAPSLDRKVSLALRSGDPAPLVAGVLERPEHGQLDAFNHVIRRLWDDYQRELAVPVIRALVENHPDAAISQYWLSQLRGVEPELAAKALDDQFWSHYFKPQVAATCGTAG